MMDMIMYGGPLLQAVVGLTGLGVLALGAAFILVLVARKTGKAEGAARGVAILLLLCVPIPFVLGLIGTWSELHDLNQALEMASPEQRTSLEAMGRSMVDFPKILGLCSSMSCMFPAALLCVLAARKRP